MQQQVDHLMDILWSGGVNNPMDSIEQLSYLIFLRLLSERDEQLAAVGKKYKRLFAGEWARYAWGNFVTLSGDALYNAARDAIEKIAELPGLSPTGATLFSRATLKIYDRPTLRAVIQGIHEMDLEAHGGLDLKGDMYEYLLSKLSMSGTNGQFRTPRHIIDLIVKLVDPQPGHRLIDPACGTAGFLIAAFLHILRQHSSKAALERGELLGDLLTPAQWKFLEEQAFTGFDNDANMVKIAILNLYLHKLEKADVRFFNPLTQSLGGEYPGQQFRYILANPPFAGKIQKESILEDLNLDSRNTELLFLKWFMDHLEAGGRAGVIVPNGVLFGSTRAAKRLREMLLTEFDLQAIINLASGVFKPYSGVGTAVLIFERLPSPVPRSLRSGERAGDGGFVWFYDLAADGYSMDDKRAPVDANDIPDLLAKWPTRAEGSAAYRVPLAKILASDDLSLAAGRYRPVTAQAANHDAPREILTEVLTLEEEIAEKAKRLMRAIGS